MTDPDWDARLAAAWAGIHELDDDDLLSIDALVAERDETDAAAAFEAASVRDHLGLEPEAEPLE